MFFFFFDFTLSFGFWYLPYLLISLLILAVCSPPPLPVGSILHTSCGVMFISMFFRPLLLSAWVLKVIITQVTTERNYSATLSCAYDSFITYGLLTHIPVQHSSLRTSFMQPFNGPVFRRVAAVNHRMVQWYWLKDWLSDSKPLQWACQSVLWHKTKPPIASEAKWCLCVNSNFSWWACEIWDGLLWNQYINAL